MYESREYGAMFSPLVWKLLVAFAIIIGGTAVSVGGNVGERFATKEEAADFLWAATVSNFDKLESGVYRATGYVDYRRGRTRIDSESGETLIRDRFNPEVGWKTEWTRELKFFSAFDFSEGLYRIDRSQRQNGRVRGGASSKRRPGNDKDSNSQWATYQWVQTREKSIRAFRNVGPGGAPTATIGIVNPEGVALYQPLLDIRTLPLVSYTGLKKLGFPYEEVINTWKDYTVTKVDRGGDGLYHVFYRDDVKGLDLVQSRWFDPEQGFMLIRRQVGWDAPGYMEQPPFEWSETQWTEVGDVWVPRTYHAVLNGVEQQQEISLVFEWKSVNKPIDATLFTVDGMGLAKGTAVLDARSSPDDPVQLRIIGIEPRFTKVPIKPIPDTDSSRLRLWLIVANVVVLGVLAVVIVWRWRVRRTRENHH